MDEVVKQFGVSPILLAAQIVNFLILLFLLKKFAYKPLLEMLQKRRDIISQSLKDAAQIEQRLKSIEEEKAKSLKKAADEAKLIINEATKAANELMEESRVRTEQEILKLQAKNKEMMERQKEQLQKEIRAQLADLVVLGLEKVVGKTLTTRAQKELVETAIKSL